MPMLQGVLPKQKLVPIFGATINSFENVDYIQET
jgi:hypothetical protein